jgi:Ca-activated chloride channel family protein
MAPPPSHYAMAEMTAAPSTEAYKDYGVNPPSTSAKDRLSTFAIDVDTASYAISRRKLVEGALPPYQPRCASRSSSITFDYAYAAPTAKGRSRSTSRLAPSPFRRATTSCASASRRKRVDREAASPCTSSTWSTPAARCSARTSSAWRRRALKLLTEHLKPGDTVALCTYAGSTREVLAAHRDRDKARSSTRSSSCLGRRHGDGERHGQRLSPRVAAP